MIFRFVSISTLVASTMIAALLIAQPATAAKSQAQQSANPAAGKANAGACQDAARAKYRKVRDNGTSREAAVQRCLKGGLGAI
ncbi:MAG TPA: hypothetical protein VIH40_02605 [Xanthobacteraceae bacterium]